MRTNTADQHMVAVKHQVLRGDGGGDIAALRLYKLRGIACGDVLHHDF